MTPLTIAPISAEETLSLRHSVLWPDKPFNYVRLDDDADGKHFGGFVDGQLVSVISLFVDGPKARFRKFATHPDHQGQGIGTQLLNRVIAEARTARAHELWCDARLTAAAFYERFGMKADGVVFFKGDIPYSRFVMTL